jgi:ligand-binding sensor domain-containing protein
MISKAAFKKRTISAIVSGVVFLSACNGQEKTTPAQNDTTVAVAQTKLLKAQNSTEADNVHCIMQDKKGNIWFATTADGVYVYDGKGFTNYTTKNGLISNSVFSLLEDNTGAIWLGTDSGLTRYSGNTFTPVPVTENSGFNNQFTNTPTNDVLVNCIIQDKKGLIWLATESGVYCYDGRTFSLFTNNPQLNNPNKFTLKSVTCALEDSKGNIWFTTRAEGIYRFDGSAIVNYRPDNLAWFFDVFEDNKGNIWVGNRAGDGLYRFDGTGFIKDLQNLGLNQYVVSSMVQDNAGNLWFGTEADDPMKRETHGGLWCYNGTTLKNYTIKDGLINYSVFYVFIDNNQHIWIGGRNTSLSRYDGKTITNFSE